MKSKDGNNGKQGYFPWSAQTAMSEEASEFFEENGYVILTNFANPQQVTSMRSAASKIIEDFHANPPSEVSVFTTHNQDSVMAKTKYFLNSSSQVSCFLEEKDESSVNKIGHALHELVPEFENFSFAPRIGAIAKSLGIEHASLVQSMYILKNAIVGGEVKPHRDATFIRDKNGHCLGYWWALEDATLTNGCLWAVPKSHHDVHNRLFALDESRQDFHFTGVDNNNYSMNDYVALPMECGDLILLHGDLIHMSKANTSCKSRHAYSIHVVSNDVANDCWLQRPTNMPFKFIDDNDVSVSNVVRGTNVVNSSSS